MRLFFDLTKNYKDIADCMYIWSATMDPNYVQQLGVNWEITEASLRERIRSNINEDLVILGIKDHLTADFSSFKKSVIIDYLNDMFNFYRDKKIILFTSLENLQEYLTNDNLTIISWGGDLTNQQAEYKKLDPIIDKNLKSPFSFISLNRNSRDHRTLALSIIFGLNLESRGLLSFANTAISKNDIQLLIDNITENKLIKTIATQGSDKLLNYDFDLKNGQNIYSNSPNDNVSNFKNNLTSSYQNCFVEFINETSCPEKCFLLTEKTLNSVYACNFPIWICSKGTVKFLREIGLDVFDDIIDHSYDNIEDAAERIYKAVELNKTFLLDNELVKNKWQQCKSRFLKNVQFVKEDLYDFYQKRAKEKFAETIKQMNDNV
jgi:hypothetical protein